MTTNRRLSSNEIQDMTRRSAAKSAARREPMNPNTLKASLMAGGALAGTIGILALRSASGGGTAESTPSGVPEGGNDNVPAATMDYLKSRPTETVTIEAGQGVRDAVYGVDPQTVGASTDLEAGVTAIVDGQVAHTATGTAMPQAGENVKVPDLPESINQVPPDAR